MSQDWAKWEKQVINGVFPLRRAVSFSDHSAVFLTEHGARNLPQALLKLVPAIPTLKDTQLAHWSAAAALEHPHLIPILETGRCQLGGLQFLFVVMEYAEVTLEKMLAQSALAPEALRKALRPILTSLAFLHRKHLVQGSLKPSNILVSNQQLKLASDTVRPTGESAASIAGSSVYDPPESRDGSFSTAGDIWSLGVIMVEALTQSRPSWPEMGCGSVALPEETPPQFAQIIRQCLSRDPSKRPTVAELSAHINPTQLSTAAPVHYPVLSPPGPVTPASTVDQAEITYAQTLERIARAQSRPTAATRSPKRRSLVPISATILAILAAAWAGERLLDPDSLLRGVTATAAPLAPGRTADSSTTTHSSSSADAVPEQIQTVVAPNSILHEEPPDVPAPALETVRGHIRIAVRVSVDQAGDVGRITLATHSPSRYFTRVATEAARKWKFVPTAKKVSRQWLLWFEFSRGGATAHAAPRAI